MKKNNTCLVIGITVLVAQGCTINVNPVTGSGGGENVVASVGIKATGSPDHHYQGEAGDTGIRGPQQIPGIEGQAGQPMNRQLQPLQSRKPKPDTAFGSKFWEKIAADTVFPSLIPALVTALVKH